MSTYREIIGKKIKKVSSDPSSGIDGEMWYNSTTKSIRGLAITEAWSSASALNTAVYYNCGAGDQTAALSFQGTAGPNPSTSTQTEEYNGSGWSIGGATPVAKRSGMGAGTQTAALSGGGATAPGTASTSTDEYNGTAWTSANALSTGRRYTAGCGTQTAAICVGGQNPGGTQIDSTEEYDGTNWTAGTAWPKTIRQEVLLGTQTATLGAGGYSTTTEVEAYEYDGSSWTATGDMNQQRYVFQGFGTQTVGIVCGGEPAPDAATKTESYNGATFSTSPATLGNPTAQAASGVASPGTAGIIFGDAAGGTTGQTEEYTKSTNTITAGAWASGGAMGTARTGLASAGTKDANVFIGGQMSNSPNAPLNTVELYNGTTWSSNPNNAPYSASNNCGTGTQTAALSWGGYPNITTTLEFDGSSFTTTGALGTGRELTSNNIGVQTAAIAASGFQRPGTYPTQTEEYNGSSWTGGPVVNTPRYGAAGAGTTTAALISGGIEPGQLSNAEEYNGSSWTNVTSRPFAAGNAGTSGTQTASLAYGGNPGGALTTTVSYDGTSWATSPSMAQARAMMGSSAGGTSTAALASSGAAPTATEEFTGQTETANIKDFTATQS